MGGGGDVVDVCSVAGGGGGGSLTQSGPVTISHHCNQWGE